MINYTFEQNKKLWSMGFNNLHSKIYIKGVEEPFTCRESDTEEDYPDSYIYRHEDGTHWKSKKEYFINENGMSGFVFAKIRDEGQEAREDGKRTDFLYPHEILDALPKEAMDYLVETINNTDEYNLIYVEQKYGETASYTIFKHVMPEYVFGKIGETCNLIINGLLYRADCFSDSKEKYRVCTTRDCKSITEWNNN